MKRILEEHLSKEQFWLIDEKLLLDIGSCTKEFFLFHMFAHMSYHFISGGCGIRPLMDIWIAEHKMGITYTEAKDLLETAGIYKFAVEMSKLSEICFSDCPKDNYTDALLSYVFDGGVYGTSKNKIAVKKNKKYISIFDAEIIHALSKDDSNFSDSKKATVPIAILLDYQNIQDDIRRKNANINYRD